MARTTCNSVKVSAPEVIVSYIIHLEGSKEKNNGPNYRIICNAFLIFRTKLKGRKTKALDWTNRMEKMEKGRHRSR